MKNLRKNPKKEKNAKVNAAVVITPSKKLSTKHLQ